MEVKLKVKLKDELNELRREFRQRDKGNWDTDYEWLQCERDFAAGQINILERVIEGEFNK